jgi:pimeloyl-ACP methyl ester carboxylesterase
VDGPFRTPDQVDAGVREQVSRMQMDVFTVPFPLDAEIQPLVPPAMTRLEELQVPTLIIVGELDQPDFLSIADALVQRVAGARKVFIPGVAHLPNMEKPEEFNRIVLDFLNRASR